MTLKTIAIQSSLRWACDALVVSPSPLCVLFMLQNLVKILPC